MIEVFKTNVRGRSSAMIVAEHIRMLFPHYKVNFDLDDCDHILRVECESGIRAETLVACVRHTGFEAEVLADELPANVSHAEPAFWK